MAVTVNEDTAAMLAAADHYKSNSEINNSGVRVVSKGVFMDALKKHDVTEADYKKLQKAIDYETTAAAHVAMLDTEEKIAAASKEDLASEDYRKALTSTVRLPTLGGSTEVEFFTERHSRVPARGDQPESIKISHGRVRTTTNIKSRIEKSFHDEADLRIRKAIGLDK